MGCVSGFRIAMADILISCQALWTHSFFNFYFVFSFWHFSFLWIKSYASIVGVVVGAKNPNS